jgi:hypothetical protein
MGAFEPQGSLVATTVFDASVVTRTCTVNGTPVRTDDGAEMSSQHVALGAGAALAVGASVFGEQVVDGDEATAPTEGIRVTAMSRSEDMATLTARRPTETRDIDGSSGG